MQKPYLTTKMTFIHHLRLKYLNYKYNDNFFPNKNLFLYCESFKNDMLMLPKLKLLTLENVLINSSTKTEFYYFLWLTTTGNGFNHLIFANNLI